MSMRLYKGLYKALYKALHKGLYKSLYEGLLKLYLKLTPFYKANLYLLVILNYYLKLAY